MGGSGVWCGVLCRGSLLSKVLSCGCGSHHQCFVCRVVDVALFFLPTFCEVCVPKVVSFILSKGFNFFF